MLFFVRIAVLVVFILSGYFLGLKYDAFIEGIALGVVCGLLALLMERAFKTVSLGKILGGLSGLVVGIIFANLLLLPLRRVVPDVSVVSFVLNGLLGYGGLLLGVKRGEKLTLSSLFRSFRGQDSDEHLKILDTSVIIDGRIADVCEAGFLDGVFLVP